jgi:hypothetical protein
MVVSMMLNCVLAGLLLLQEIPHKEIRMIVMKEGTVFLCIGLI